MAVARLTLELTIEHAASLKDRRQVVRSVKERLRAGFNVSVSEMDDGALWNRATLGVAAISNSRDYLTGQMAEVERAARAACVGVGAEIADIWWEYLEAEDAG